MGASKILPRKTPGSEGVSPHPQAALELTTNGGGHGGKAKPNDYLISAGRTEEMESSGGASQALGVTHRGDIGYS